MDRIEETCGSETITEEGLGCATNDVGFRCMSTQKSLAGGLGLGGFRRGIALESKTPPKITAIR
jgi:hypothetical protein